MDDETTIAGHASGEDGRERNGRFKPGHKYYPSRGGPLRRLNLFEINGSTRNGRRFRDYITAWEDEHGISFDDLSLEQRTNLETAAGEYVWQSLLRARRLNGEPIDDEKLNSSINIMRRALRAI